MSRNPSETGRSIGVHSRDIARAAIANRKKRDGEEIQPSETPEKELGPSRAVILNPATGRYKVAEDPSMTHDQLEQGKDGCVKGESWQLPNGSAITFLEDRLSPIETIQLPRVEKTLFIRQSQPSTAEYRIPRAKPV